MRRPSPATLFVSSALLICAVIVFTAGTAQPAPADGDAGAESTAAHDAGHGSETQPDAHADEHGHEAAAMEGGHGHDEEHGEGGHGLEVHTLDVSIYSLIPFVVLLLAIAALPVFFEEWWEPNRNKALVSIPLGLLALGYLFINFGGDAMAPVLEAIFEYAAFIALLFSLFVISGGVFIRGRFIGTPTTNTTIMAIGGILASLIGTTGAAMVLIRPILRANRVRKGSPVHVVIFFIFIVANCGGLLTPLGDPPLFLGFLKGIPFQWEVLNLVPHWAFVVGSLLVIFYIFDVIKLRMEGGIDYNRVDAELTPPAAIKGEVPPPDMDRFGIDGKVNLLLLGCVVGVVILSGIVTPLIRPHIESTLTFEAITKLGQAFLLALLGVISLIITPLKAATRKNNEFSFHPINEVAVLFAGIFLAMVPALQFLNVHGGELIGSIKSGVGIDLQTTASPWIYFWCTGALSAFLDNAPTYLTFLSTAEGALRSQGLEQIATPSAMAGSGFGSVFLAAISTGAVFMGALSYLGNGPNFMVKAIAEQRGVKMPSLFGYMIWSVLILLPIMVLVALIWFGNIPIPDAHSAAMP
jgi:Na+/H+ antiporter NhaD/arsenite permease-like protein